jgi:hypothetical protein
LFENPTMKFRMTKTLGFWVEAAYDEHKDDDGAGTRAQVMARILCEFEEAGDAMRYLRVDGQIAWKATPAMLSRLADAEQEVEDDMAEWL